jgi:hypothetical protein
MENLGCSSPAISAQDDASLDGYTFHASYAKDYTSFITAWIATDTLIISTETESLSQGSIVQTRSDLGCPAFDNVLETKSRSNTPAHRRSAKVARRKHRCRSCTMELGKGKMKALPDLLASAESKSSLATALGSSQT